MKGPGLPMSRSRMRTRGRNLVHKIVPAKAQKIIKSRHNQLKEIATALTGISKEEINRADHFIAELIGEDEEPLVRDEPPYFDPVSKWPSDEQNDE